MTKPDIIIIDDEPEILENYKELLSDEYNVLSFDEPKKFLDALSKQEIKNIDLVLSDFKMPKMDGLEMIRRAQKLEYKFPFILQSGFLDKKTILDALDLGAFRLLEKPINSRMMVDAIEQLLIEHDLIIVRDQIRLLTQQLRELYSTSRLVFEQYVPQDVLDRMIVDAPGGVIKGKLSFEDLLDQLEDRLGHLLKSEKALTELRVGGS